jgi:Zn-dependent oligopeptidase
MESYLDGLNSRYVHVHTRNENSFWSSKMKLASMNENDAMDARQCYIKFVSNADELTLIRKELSRQDLSVDERRALEGWKHFFQVNAIESNEAKEIQMELTRMESALAKERSKLKMGYEDPKSGKFIETSWNKLKLMVATESEEALRLAAWRAGELIENLVLEAGYLDIVKMRNKFARLLGFSNHYAYKLETYEGFTPEKLFEIFDSFLEETRTACINELERMKSEYGETSIEPWNFEYCKSGNMTRQLDPYFSFEKSLGRWGRTFHNLGIRYRGATLTLDLLSRSGKYDNGFMHGPFPAFRSRGVFQPAKINFTANAVLGQVGAGAVTLRTLFHEGGHAAHFSNIDMPAPCFAQENAPTSIAFAETQSMFLDHLIADEDWIMRYAHDDKGQPPSSDLLEERIKLKSQSLIFQLRPLLGTVYSEYAIYCLPDEDLTAENVRKTVADEGMRVEIRKPANPALVVPHLLAAESSAYCHGYVLAEMAVSQTRAYFLSKYGYILDNPNVGRELTEHYWKEGNSRSFQDYIEGLTGKPFSAAAKAAEMQKTYAELIQLSKKSIELEVTIPKCSDPIALDAHIRIIHGDEEVANTQESFEAFERSFLSWIRSKKGE